MKCGSCRNREADAYTRIKPDNKLFGVLKTLNPKYAYNPKYSLYCNACIKLAEQKLANKSTTNTSAAVSSLNPSISNNNSDQSGGSMDEYDSLVAAIVFSDKGTPLVYPSGQRKRPAEPASRPCPKSRKPLASLQLEKNPESSSVHPGSSQQKISSNQQAPVSQQTSETSSEQSSQSNPEKRVLIAIAEADSSFSSADEQPEQHTQSSSNNLLLLGGDDDSSLSADVQQPRKSTPKPVQNSSVSLSSKDLHSSGGRKRKSPARRDDDYHIPNSPDQEALPGPLAPAVQNPRLRDLRQFFSVRDVEVNNYARTLGG